MNYFRIRFCVFLCVFTRASLFVLGLVILCLVYFLFYCLVVNISAIYFLESLISKMTYYVSSGTLNDTHSLVVTKKCVESRSQNDLLLEVQSNAFVGRFCHDVRGFG